MLQWITNINFKIQYSSLIKLIWYLYEGKDNDYRSEESEEDVVYSDFDQEDEQEQIDTNKKRKIDHCGHDDDERVKRKRKKLFLKHSRQ